MLTRWRQHIVCQVVTLVSVDFQQLNGLYHLLKTPLNPEP